MDTERNHFPFGVFCGETYSYEDDLNIPPPEIVIPKLSFALPIEIEESEK